jgi:response regulator of citrate/malate metabolism
VSRALIVEDDSRVAKVHAGFTERVPGFEVVATVHTASAALAAVSAQRPDLLLLDVYLPDASGLDVLRRVTVHSEPPDVIMLTAASDVANVRAAVRSGAVAYLIKPLDAEALAGRLSAYADLRAQRSADRQADQAEVDRLFSLPAHGARGSLSLPKGHSATTAGLILDALGAARDPLSAGKVAERVGVSRATAQRYLALLAVFRPGAPTSDRAGGIAVGARSCRSYRRLSDEGASKPTARARSTASARRCTPSLP